jgi:hypothetical protein
MNSACSGHVHICRLLLEAGADAAARNKCDGGELFPLFFFIPSSLFELQRRKNSAGIVHGAKQSRRRGVSAQCRCAAIACLAIDARPSNSGRLASYVVGVRFCRKKLDAGRGSKALKYVPTAFAQLPFYRDAFAVGGFIRDQGCDVYHILVHHSLCRNLCQSICCIVVHSPTCMSNRSMLLKSFVLK